MKIEITFTEQEIKEMISTFLERTQNKKVKSMRAVEEPVYGGQRDEQTGTKFAGFVVEVTDTPKSSENFYDR